MQREAWEAEPPRPPTSPSHRKGSPSLPRVSLALGQHKMWTWPSKPTNYLEILKTAQETPSTLQEGGIDDRPILGAVWQSVCIYPMC